MAPSSASRSATARPIPLDAPVTIATFPLNDFINRLLFLNSGLATESGSPTVLKTSILQSAVDSLPGVHVLAAVPEGCWDHPDSRSRSWQPARSLQEFGDRLGPSRRRNPPSDGQPARVPSPATQDFQSPIRC